MTNHDLVRAALEALAPVRPVFHSEADFQLALAMQLERMAPRAAVRCEKREPLGETAPKRRTAVDIVMTRDGERHAIELKYTPCTAMLEHAGEIYDLRAGPTDSPCYDVLKDLGRVERFGRGTVIALTNWSTLWLPTNRPCSFVAFRLTEGRTVDATPMDWTPEVAPSTVKTRPGPLTLLGSYVLRWAPYSDLGTPRGEFRVLVIDV